MNSVHEPLTYNPVRERFRLVLGRLFGANTAKKIALLYHGWQYRKIAGFIPIDGWLAHGEAILLYETARLLPRERPVVCEIGSWQGKSTIVIAKGLEDKQDPHLYCIDPFNADGDAASLEDYRTRQAGMAGGLRRQFERNLEREGVRGMVHPLPGYSHDVAPSFEEAIDFLFIDGNHAYEAVRKDFEDWAPKVKPGGYVAFHDVSFNNPDTGPQRVIRESVLDTPRWTEPTHVQGLFRARKAT